jgi:hypothetical protein
VHFVRVSVDGAGPTYETLRGRSFAELRRRLDLIAGTFRLGLNCVVNTATLPDLDAVADLAAQVGARELLLLPQRPARGRPGSNATVVADGGRRPPVVVAVLADVDHAKLIARIEVEPGGGHATGANSHRVMDGGTWPAANASTQRPSDSSQCMISLDFERPDAASASKCWMLVRASRPSFWRRPKGTVAVESRGLRLLFSHNGAVLTLHDVGLWPAIPVANGLIARQ